MKITVITVCLNSVNTIFDTIASVASQEYHDVEHIIIDGGSTDGTIEKINGAAHSNPLVIVSEPDRGIYDAMNKGLSLATGDIIGFLNSDDIFEGNWVVRSIAENMSNTDVVYADVKFYKDSQSKTPFRHYSSKSFSPQMLSIGMMPAHPTLYVRRDIYKEIGHFNTRYRIAADFDMVVRLWKKLDLRWKYCPQVWVKMRLGGISNRNMKTILLLNKETLASCRDNGISTSWIKLIYKYFVKIRSINRPWVDAPE